MAAVFIYINSGCHISYVGHHIVIYAMVYEQGIYHWARPCAAFIPCDQADSGRIVHVCICFSLWRYVATLSLENVNIGNGVFTNI